MSGGGGTTTATSSSTTTPWSGQQPYLSQAFGQAQQLDQGNAPQYYTGTQISPMTGAQNAGLGGIESQAAGGEPITASTSNFDTALQGGGYFNAPNTATLNAVQQGQGAGSPALNAFANGNMLGAGNPYSQATVNSMLGSIIPQTESTFTSGGAINNPSAAYATSQGAAAGIAPMEQANYQQGLTQMQNAASTLAGNQLAAAQQQGNQFQGTLGDMTSSLMTAPQVQGMAYTDANNMYNAGTAQQAQQQNEINANISKWNFNQELPYNLLSNYLGNVGGGLYGSSTVENTPYQNNSLANILGAGTGVAGLLSGASSAAGYGGNVFGSGGLLSTSAGGGLG